MAAGRGASAGASAGGGGASVTLAKSMARLSSPILTPAGWEEDSMAWFTIRRASTGGERERGGGLRGLEFKMVRGKSGYDRVCLSYHRLLAAPL